MRTSAATDDVPVVETSREFAVVRRRARGTRPVVCARKQGDEWAAYYDLYTISYRLSEEGKELMRGLLESYARAAGDAVVETSANRGELVGLSRSRAIDVAEAVREITFNTRHWRVVELSVDSVPAESVPGGEHPSPPVEAVRSGEWLFGE